MGLGAGQAVKDDSTRPDCSVCVDRSMCTESRETKEEIQTDIQECIWEESSLEVSKCRHKGNTGIYESGSQYKNLSQT